MILNQTILISIFLLLTSCKGSDNSQILAVPKTNISSSALIINRTPASTPTYAQKSINPIVISVNLDGALTPLPMASFKVENFGARADGLTDSGKALQSAINAAIMNTQANGTPAEVVLAAGTYRLACPSDSIGTPGYCLSVNGGQGITIRGQGIDATKIIISNPIMGLINVEKTKGFALNSFSIDYSTLPFTQGTIQSVNIANKSFRIALDAGYPDFTLPLLSDPKYEKLLIGLTYEQGTSSPHFKNNFSWNKIGSFTHISGNKWELGNVSSSHSSNIMAGDRFSFAGRVITVLNFYNSENIGISHVKIFSGPGAASIWQSNSGKIIINDFQIRLKPGRLVSTAADAIHMMNNSAKVIIKNCFIEGMADDAINIYSQDLSITNIINSSIQFNITHNLLFSAGQTLQFIDPVTSKIKGKAIIASYGLDQSTRIATITLDKAIPDLAVNDKILNIDMASPRALIVNNVFNSFRGAFRIRSAGAIFQGNQILAPENAQVFMDYDLAYREGPSVLTPSVDGVQFYNNKTPNGLWYQSTTSGDRLNFQIPNPKNLYLLLTPEISSDFDENFYRSSNPDLQNYNSAEIKEHWINYGISEGRVASPRFSSSEYLKMYSDLSKGFGANNYTAAHSHYYAHGRSEGHTGRYALSPLVFNWSYYLKHNLDLITLTEEQAVLHWLFHGQYEGRVATLEFSSAEYLGLYSDLSVNGGSTNYPFAIQHYVLEGASKGRIGRKALLPTLFNSKDYTSYYEDLFYLDDIQAKDHWLDHGISEGRRGVNILNNH